MADVPEWVVQVIDEYSTDRFHIEQDGYKFNHLLAAFVALWQLGANEQHLRTFADDYKYKLDPARIRPGKLPPTHRRLSPERLQELLGERKSYLELVGHFQQRLVDLGNDLDLLIKTEFPQYIPALAASAVHGPIQMGYAYYIRHERLVCEALAYLHFGHMEQAVSSRESLIDCLGTGKTGFVDLLRQVRNDGHLLNYMFENLRPFEDDRHHSQFLRRMHTLLLEKSDELIDLVRQIKLPNWFDKDNLDEQMIKDFGNWMLDEAIKVVALADSSNNFFLIHNVTGAWSMRQILPLLDDKNDILESITYTLCTVIAVYVVEECSPLRDENLEFEPASWEAIRTKNCELGFDEHAHKNVQVCQQRYYEIKGGDLAEDDMMVMCQKAAHLSTYNPISRFCGS